MIREIRIQYTRLSAEGLLAENGCKQSAKSATQQFFLIQIVTFKRRNAVSGA